MDQEHTDKPLTIGEREELDELARMDRTGVIRAADGSPDWKAIKRRIRRSLLRSGAISPAP